MACCVVAMMLLRRLARAVAPSRTQVRPTSVP
jgi:hypothetical protein